MLVRRVGSDRLVCYRFNKSAAEAAESEPDGMTGASLFQGPHSKPFFPGVEKVDHHGSGSEAQHG